MKFWALGAGRVGEVGWMAERDGPEAAGIVGALDAERRTGRGVEEVELEPVGRGGVSKASIKMVPE